MATYNELVDQLNNDKPRSELKKYFNRGEIPTEDDFHDWIDNMLSRRDDGIFKKIETPLCILSDATPDKNVIHFYNNSENPDNPDGELKWKLSMAGGLKIKEDGSATSRLFIKEGGNVGIGTNGPSGLLHLVKKSEGTGPILKIEGPNGAEEGARIRFIEPIYFGPAGGGSPRSTFEINHDGLNEKLIFRSLSSNGGVKNDNLLVLDWNEGGIGIGADNPDPDASLHIAKTTTGGDGPILKIESPRDRSNGARIRFAEASVTGTTSMSQFEIKHNANSNQLIFRSLNLDDTVKHDNLLVLDWENDSIGIGKSAPSASLHIAKTTPGGEGPVLEIEGPKNAENGSRIRFIESFDEGGPGFLSDQFEILHDASNNKLTFNSKSGTVRHDNLLVIDGGEERIGIGIDNPGASLHIAKTDINSNGPTLTLQGPNKFGGEITRMKFTNENHEFEITQDITSRVGSVSNNIKYKAKIGQDEFNDLLVLESSVQQTGSIKLLESIVSIGSNRFDAPSESYKPGGGSWKNSSSDQRLKEDISNFTDGLDLLVQVNPVIYKYNGKMGFPKDKEYIGVIAQDIIQYFPYMVGTFQGKLNEEDQDTTELYNLDSSAFTYILINAVKELANRLQRVEKKVGHEAGPIPKPAKSSTKALIQAYLKQQGIAFKTSETKDELLKKIVP